MNTPIQYLLPSKCKQQKITSETYILYSLREKKTCSPINLTHRNYLLGVMLLKQAFYKRLRKQFHHFNELMSKCLIELCKSEYIIPLHHKEHSFLLVERYRIWNQRDSIYVFGEHWIRMKALFTKRPITTDSNRHSNFGNNRSPRKYVCDKMSTILIVGKSATDHKKVGGHLFPI